MPLYHADQFVSITTLDGKRIVRKEKTNSAIIEAENATIAWNKALDKFNEGK